MQTQDEDYRNGMLLLAIVGAADIAFLALLLCLLLSGSGCSSPHRAFVASVPSLDSKAERRVCYGDKLIVLRERWPNNEGDNWSVRFYRKTDHTNIYEFHYVVKPNGNVIAK